MDGLPVDVLEKEVFFERLVAAHLVTAQPLGRLLHLVEGNTAAAAAASAAVLMN